MNKILSLIVLGSTSLAFADQPAPQQPLNPQQKRTYSREMQRTEQESGPIGSAADQEIVKKIRETLNSGWLSKGFQDFTVDVTDGNLVIKGTVNSAEDKKNIEEKLKKIPGIKSLKSDLTVQNSDSSDPEIAKNIHDVLASSWFSKGFQGVTFEVIDGNVIIRGPVNTLDEKAKIEEDLKKIKGVKSVDNELSIKSGLYSDEEISNKISEALSSGWFSNGYKDVNFTVTAGDVTIKGPVETSEEKTKVEESLKKIEGIKSISNQLVVKGSKGAESDQQITQKINDLIGPGWFSKGFQGVAFDVVNGNVTLKGSVNSLEDKNKIEESLKKIDGVRSVNNMLAIKKK